MNPDTTIRLTRAQSRHVDEVAINTLGMPGIMLMENAGRNAAHVVIDRLVKRGVADDAARVAVICGGGNNGGDGYVIARHLHNRGSAVTCYALKPVDRLTGDALTNATIADRIGITIVPCHAGPDAVAAHRDAWHDAHIVVDALLGTGFAGTAREPVATAIRQINSVPREHTSVIAIDVPSGLDCDTGIPTDPTVQADITVTFVAAKTGFGTPQAQRVLGEWVVADIGAPPSIIQTVRTGS